MPSHCRVLKWPQHAVVECQADDACHIGYDGALRIRVRFARERGSGAPLSG